MAKSFNRMTYLVAAVLSTALSVSPALADPFEQHFSPAENLEAVDVALLDEAGETIDMAAYVLTDVPVIEALTRAAERGVKVRIYRWPDEHEAGGQAAMALSALMTAGAEIRFKDRHRPLMHLKSFCADGGMLRLGAANFSHSGLTKQDNDLEIVRGPGVCARFERNFAEMWERQ